MSLQETAIAIGLLTPLILGILAFIEKFVHRKKEPDPEEPQVVQGMTVAMENPYADQLISELRREITEADSERQRLSHQNEILRARLGLGKEDA
jgi:hypothetical protein